MNRRETIRRGVVPLLLGAAAWAGLGGARGQGPAATPAPPPTTAVSGPAAVTGPNVAEEVGPVIAPEIQVVKLRPPEGARIEVLGPATEPVPSNDPRIVGMRVGASYRLRIWGLEGRPEVEIFPVVQIVGHLHRPTMVDPARFPIRIAFDRGDLEDAVDRGRLVTMAVYLEDPEQALPISMPKDEIPTATLTASEDPVKVGAALGRVMAVVRIGARTPGPEEVNGPDGLIGIAPVPCPFAGPMGGRCGLPCGPARGTAPPAGPAWLPRDEFLCDGGDRAEPLHFGGDGGLRGIDPRDALIRFRDDRRPRILPTNIVCIYAPRFAAVRTSIGPLQAETVEVLQGLETRQRQVTSELLQGPRRLVKNETAEINRHRSRPSVARNRIVAGETLELRILRGFDTRTSVAGANLVQRAETKRQREKAAGAKLVTRAVGIKTAESSVVTGIVEGTAEQVSTWRPQETVGVELPPNKTGLAVIKRVSTGVAEPGDLVSFVIQYRNMGNVPITSVSVIDSLLPRLEYVAGSAAGPAGTVFSAVENRAGGTELRWDLPGALAPGQEGSVTFQTRVR